MHRETTSLSRLMFVEAVADYQSLATKFAKRQNILIVKGLSKANYHASANSYTLYLKALTVSNIMVPLQFNDIFSSLARLKRREAKPPRYAAEVK